MTDSAVIFDHITTHYENITFYSRMVAASAVLNIVCWAALIYASFKLRKAAREFRRTVEEWTRLHPAEPPDEFVVIPRLEME